MHTMTIARDTDGRLVRSAQVGDTSALALLWQRYEQRVRAIVRGYVSAPEDRDDLVQDVLLRAMEGLPHLRDVSQFRSWLDQVARRRCIDHLRRQRRVRFQSLEPLVGEGEEPGECEYASADPGVEDLVVSDALRAAADEALGDLSDAGRTAFLMRANDDATLREIASAVGVSEGAVKSLVYRARRALERELEPFLAA